MGMMESRKESVINMRLGHIQIQSDTYDYDPNILNYIQEFDKIEKALENHPDVKGFTPRFISDGMLRTARELKGVKINGIDIEKDAQTLNLTEKVEQGEFFGDEFKYPIALSEKMASELKLELGSKVSLNLTKMDSTQTAKNFKVAAIFKSGDGMYDELNVFVPRETIYKVIGADQPIVHRVIVRLDNIDKADLVKADLVKTITKDKVLTWLEADPYSAYAEESFGMMIGILMGIFLSAVLFGIINTAVMSILERKREIGVLLAIGMTKRKIRTMIAIESLIYGFVGGPLGVFLGWITIAYFQANGMDLSGYGDAMESYGMEAIVYFQLPVKFYFIYGIAIIGTSLLGSLYPAYLSTKLNPIEAIRSV